MGHYELRGDRKVWVEDATKPPKTTSIPPKKVEVKEPDTYYNPSQASDDYEYAHYGRSYGAIAIISIVLVLASFIVGQIITWIRFNRIGEIYILSGLVDMGKTGFSEKIFGIIVSLVLAAACVLMIVSALRMDDESSLLTYAITYIPFCVFTSVIPIISAIPLVIYATSLLIITVVIDENKATSITSFVAIPVILSLAIILFVVGYTSPSSLKKYSLQKATTFEEISEYVHSETVALDISQMDSEKCGKITVGSECQRLVIVGNKNKSYNNLIIETSATEVVIKNLNIDAGYLTFKSEKSQLIVYGNNVVHAPNGSNAAQNSGTSNGNGVSGNNGSSGRATLYAEALLISGTGRLELYSGNGGNGGNGSNGSGSLFGNGGSGGNGGNGGDSGYVVECSRLSSVDFRGLIIMTKGAPGTGGAAGRGGSGGLFGSNGSNGRAGATGKIRDYSNGTIEVEERYIEYN